MAADIALKILVALGTKLLTETFLAKLVVHSLKAISERTENKLDDKLIQDLAEALDVST